MQHITKRTLVDERNLQCMKMSSCYGAAILSAVCASEDFNGIGVLVRAPRIRGPIVRTKFKRFGGVKHVPAKVMKQWEVTQPVLKMIVNRFSLPNQTNADLYQSMQRQIDVAQTVEA